MDLKNLIFSALAEKTKSKDLNFTICTIGGAIIGSFIWYGYFVCTFPDVVFHPYFSRINPYSKILYSKVVYGSIIGAMIGGIIGNEKNKYINE
jgi:hypothetical protein